MARQRSRTGDPQPSPATLGGTAPRRAAIASGAALALFLLVLADTLWHGPLSQVLVPVNQAVIAWGEAGFPIHPVGSVLSWVGDFWLGWATVLAAAGLCIKAKSWPRAVVVLAAAALLPGTVALLQGNLTEHNVPIPGLSERIVPDTDSAPREGGEHLFPSGHVAEGTLDWGLLLLIGIPTYVASRRMPDAVARRWLLGSRIAWACIPAIVAAGRILRQAHGLNDALAGFGLGAFLLFGAVAVAQWRWPLADLARAVRAGKWQTFRRPGRGH